MHLFFLAAIPVIFLTIGLLNKTCRRTIVYLTREYVRITSHDVPMGSRDVPRTSLNVFGDQVDVPKTSFNVPGDSGGRDEDVVH
ncbi:unnamed protein product [Heligmosomoides polygyrus]|uniref:Secreted protein n=1 Tax=Heligmosomoides polygyrus TaxID=6339 RepID=A0A3P8AXV5_HELPZ|nr:unnamed protein product [Heligmosomoides polygyrus]